MATPWLRSMLLSLALAGCSSTEGMRRAIVHPDGEVIACLGAGAFVFADACEGPVNTETVYPLQDGSIRWQMARGTIGRDSPAYCQIFRAQEEGERSSATTDRQIVRLDHTSKDLRQRVYAALTGGGKGEAEVQSAYAVDLDGDGQEEIVFVVNNVATAVKAFENANRETEFTVAGGIMRKGASNASLFYLEKGVYRGGTDAIGEVALVGVTRLDPGSREIAVVADAGNMFSSWRMLLRFNGDRLHAIQAVDRSCS